MPNEVWSWDITYLPTDDRGIWLYLYVVIDVWSRKVVAWDVAERAEANISADLFSRDCLRERIMKGHRQPLSLHADNGNAMRAATLESRLDAPGVLRSFSRPRVSNDNPYSESLFRTMKYRPDYPTPAGHSTAWKKILGKDILSNDLFRALLLYRKSTRRRNCDLFQGQTRKEMCNDDSFTRSQFCGGKIVVDCLRAAQK